jgi:hypothetical protein
MDNQLSSNYSTAESLKSIDLLSTPNAKTTPFTSATHAHTTTPHTGSHTHVIRSFDTISGLRRVTHAGRPARAAAVFDGLPCLIAKMSLMLTPYCMLHADDDCVDVYGNSSIKQVFTVDSNANDCDPGVSTGVGRYLGIVRGVQRHGVRGRFGL